MINKPCEREARYVHLISWIPRCVSGQLDLKFSQDSRVKISTDSCESRYEFSLRVLLRNFFCKTCYEISFCETRKKWFTLQNSVARLASRKSRYKISVCETHKKWVSLLILTRQSHETLARILGLKSKFCFSREFQKVTLVSTLPVSASGLFL